MFIYPDSKVHGANMGPIWGRQDPGGLHVGPMNVAIWVYTEWHRTCWTDEHWLVIRLQIITWSLAFGTHPHIGAISTGACFTITKDVFLLDLSDSEYEIDVQIFP